jgi:substrate import-associated zinc metallohydrolase lipoprotein
LNQQKPYTSNFRVLSATDYVGDTWNTTYPNINVDTIGPARLSTGDSAALKMGFITPYASSADTEDFVELIALYLTQTPAAWNDRLAVANMRLPLAKNEELSGREKIETKFAMVVAYMRDEWKIDLHKLRDIIAYRRTQVNYLDLNNLD